MQIDSRPELKFEERFAVEQLSRAISALGLRTEVGVAGLETAFRAEFGSSSASIWSSGSGSRHSDTVSDSAALSDDTAARAGGLRVAVNWQIFRGMLLSSRPNPTWRRVRSLIEMTTHTPGANRLFDSEDHLGHRNIESSLVDARETHQGGGSVKKRRPASLSLSSRPAGSSFPGASHYTRQQRGSAARAAWGERDVD